MSNSGAKRLTVAVWEKATFAIRIMGRTGLRIEGS
jgi:hypothetical protein